MLINVVALLIDIIELIPLITSLDVLDRFKSQVILQ